MTKSRRNRRPFLGNLFRSWKQRPSRECRSALAHRFESLEPRLMLHGHNGPFAADPTYDPSAAFHIHADLAIWVNSEQVVIPQGAGNPATGSASFHTHDASGRLHFHPTTPPGEFVTLGDFFDSWRNNPAAGSPATIVLSDTQLLGNVVDSTHRLQMFVNGLEVDNELADYQIHDEDDIVLVYTSNPVVTVNTNLTRTNSVTNEEVPIRVPVELFRDKTPGTVANFLNYVNDGDYDNSIFHRYVSGFVLQGGGFETPSTTFSSSAQFTSVPTDAQIQNEFAAYVRATGNSATVTQGSTQITLTDAVTLATVQAGDRLNLPGRVDGLQGTGFFDIVSVDAANNRVQVSVAPTGASAQNVAWSIAPPVNVPLTVAMAKLGGNPDSATSQFFVNLADNTLNLDGQNGGFTVFATVLDPAVVTDVTELTRTNAGGAFSDLPLAPNSQLAVVQSVTGDAAVHGVVYSDDDRDGVRDGNENALAGRTIFADANANGLLDANERSTQTAANGSYVLYLDWGSYTIRQVPVTFSSQTAPAANGGHAVTLEIGDSLAARDFGVSVVGAPGAVTLSAAANSGDTADTITNFNNSTAERALSFTSIGNTAGATVRLFIDGTLTDTKAADASGVATLVTSGLAAISDGVHQVIATQEVNGIQGPPSSPLNVTIDTALPGEFTSVPPGNVIVGNELTYNAQSGSEGGDLTYSLAGAPTGAAIHPTTGALSWIPTQAQLGANSFQIVAKDAAGNQRTQALNVNVIKQPQVGVRFEILPATGTTPVSEVTVGDTFRLRAFVQDRRETPGGPFAFYSDVEFNGLLATATAIEHGATFGQGKSGTFATAGLLNEVGSFGLDNRGGSEFLLWTTTFTAQRAGTLVFVGNAPDNLPANNVLLHGVDTPVPVDEILFGETNLLVKPRFGVNDDIFNIDEDSIDFELNVLANDSIQGNTNLTITAIGPAAGQNSIIGNVTITPDAKKLRYTPPANFVGEAIFQYTVTDGADTNTAEVIVQVFPVNDPPTANADTYSFLPGSVNNFLDVLVNDSFQPDSQETLTVQSITAPTAGGTATRGTGGTHILYTPATGFSGAETFSYTIADPGGLTSTATVTIEVSGAAADVFTVVEESSNNIFHVLANDIGAGMTLSAITQGNRGGTVSINAETQRVIYSPAANVFGTETFTYTAKDSQNRPSTATVTVTITNANDPPTANDDSFTVSQASSNNSLNVRGNDSSAPDPEETLTVTAVTQGTQGGTVGIAANGTAVLYTPPGGFTGTDTFTYTLIDGGGLTDTATVTVQVVPFVPGSLAGFVYIDADGDGVRDASEAGFSGVTVALAGTDAFGSNVSQTQVTTADGSYKFDALPPGTYTLTETQPTGERNGLPIVDGSETVGTQGGTLPANDQIRVTLAEGTHGAGNNFAELLGRTLSGTVAIQSAGLNSQVVGDFHLNLFRVTNDAIVEPALRAFSTDNGAFSITGLPPGEYRIVPTTTRFLQTSTSGTDVTIGNADSTNNVVRQPGRQTRYLSFRDFTNLSFQSAHVAVAPGAAHEWYTLGPGWNQFTDAQFTLSGNGATLRAVVTNSTGQQLAAEIPTNHARLRRAAQDGGVVLFQINAPSSLFNFQPVTTGNTGNGEGEAPAERQSQSDAATWSANPTIAASPSAATQSALVTTASVVTPVTLTNVANPVAIGEGEFTLVPVSTASVTTNAPIITSVPSFLTTTSSVAVGSADESANYQQPLASSLTYVTDARLSSANLLHDDNGDRLSDADSTAADSPKSDPSAAADALAGLAAALTDDEFQQLRSAEEDDAESFDWLDRDDSAEAQAIDAVLAELLGAAP